MRAAPIPSNRLLRRLPGAEAALLRPLLERREFPPGSILCEAGDAVLFAVFPESGVVSLMASAEPRVAVQIAFVGSEGMLGLSLQFGEAASPLSAIVLSDAVILRIEQAAFRLVVDRCPTLLRRLQHYAYALMIQVARTAACNSVHSIELRTARWLLLMSDRMGRSDFHVTQAGLAGMLGVQRSAISLAASGLSEAGFVRYSRGMVSVVDRSGLEGRACECYRALDAIHRVASGAERKA